MVKLRSLNMIDHHTPVPKQSIQWQIDQSASRKSPKSKFLVQRFLVQLLCGIPLSGIYPLFELESCPVLLVISSQTLLNHVPRITPIPKNWCHYLKSATVANPTYELISICCMPAGNIDETPGLEGYDS